MIPLKLQLKNFLSYGSDIQTVDFTSHSLICLSGKNGHGKSALLDAMTWALWGQGRKIAGVAKSDDNLIRIGQTHMMVALQFICNGQEYRVRREYTKSSNKPYVTLDVGVFDSIRNSFVPIGGKSIRSNQAALEQIIHLDFETFCNSAFLRQGQSNEFSKKSPKERKEILASILGLDQYESIRLLASERARTAATSRISLQAILDRMVQDVGQIKTIDECLHVLDEKFKEVAEQEHALGMQEQDLVVRRQELQSIKQQYHVTTLQQNELKKTEQELRKTLIEQSKRWRTIHAQYLKGYDYRELELKKKQIIDQIRRHQAVMRESLQHKEQYLLQKERVTRFEVEHAQKIHASIQDHTIKLERIKIEMEHFKETIVSCQKRNNELIKDQTEAHDTCALLISKITKIHADLQLYQGIVKQFDKRKAYYQNWITLGNLMAGELANLDRKKQLSQDETNPCCPLCEQNLSASRRKFLKEKFFHEEHFLQHRIARITRVVQKLKLLLIDQHKQLNELNLLKDELQKMTAQLDKTQTKITAIAQEIDAGNQQKLLCERQIAILMSQIHDQEKEMQAIQSSSHVALLQNADFQEAMHQLIHLEKMVTDYQYDAHGQDLLSTELEQTEQLIKKHEILTHEIALQEARMSQVQAIVLRLKKAKHELKVMDVQKNMFETLMCQESALTNAEQELSVARIKLKQNKELLLQERGALENDRSKLKSLEQESVELQKKIMEINGSIDDYQAIVAATGKDGIQALLIQDVLPEIEQEANELLARLTDNQAQIFIESLRDLKKGGSKETLDINISDNMGIRPYEMFSGGEAFRIDFALRIALSKMLARRAGTSLQTLIIDEGFGSQDDEGLSHIMDAIYKIQDDFAKVIIVSHLSTMKDLFPVHFHIEKKPSGSVISIIEQG